MQRAAPFTGTSQATTLADLAELGGFSPPPLRKIEDTGLSVAFVSDLMLKLMHFSGGGTAAGLADRIRLPYLGIIDGILDGLKKQALVEVRGGSSTLSLSYEFAITDRGRQRALELAERSRYAGPAPVPLDRYIAAVKTQSVRANELEFSDFAGAFSDMVLPSDVLDQVGPAVRSGRSIFLFGGPGNGKTSIGERIARLLGDGVHLPYALEADGEVIKYFDPLYHVPLEARPTRMDERDHRWVLCKRPFVTAGGELTLSSLDMTYLASGRFHEAPLQLKANCGVFLMDDFGRQQVAPHALLNRWIVPLEKDVDYLSLNSGQTLEVPFDVLLVFSTNLRPEDLVDEAFLRRIRYKIHVPDPTPEEFETIFKRVCTANALPFDQVSFDRITAFYESTGLTPRACHPRDILNQLMDVARFYRVQPKLSDQLLDLAMKSYFVRVRS